MSLDRLLKQGDRAVERVIAGREREVIRAYSQALVNIRKQIASAYEKHAVKGELTFAEMSKYNRLARLEKGVEEELRKLASRQGIKVKGAVRTVFQDSYYRTAYAFENTAQIKLGFGKLNPKVIEAAIYNPFDPLKWSDRLREHTRLLDRRIREEITQGLIQGKPYSEMARRIKDPMDKTAYKAVRIIQTECHRVQVDGRLSAFDDAEDAGVEFSRIWTATLDDATREEHQDMDGEEANEDGYFDLDGDMVRGPGLTGIAEHDINCRCNVIAQIKGYEPKVRMAREKLGEKGELISYKNYAEWEKSRIK